MVAQEPLANLAHLPRVAAASPVLDLKPAHGLATQQTSGAVLLLFVTVAALALVEGSLEVQEAGWNIDQVKLEVGCH